MARKRTRKIAAKTINKSAAAENGKQSRPRAAELKNLINQLCVERQHHIDSIAEIDETFREFGIGGGATPRKGKGGRRKGAESAPTAAKKGRGGRKKGSKAASAPKATTRRAPRSGKFA